MYKPIEDDWEDYLGKVHGYVLNKLNIPTVNTCVELAPGFRYKVAYALKSINFTGTLYVIDSDEEVCKFVKDKYSEILPDAEIITLPYILSRCVDMEILPKTIDLFISNHCLDDMILYNYMMKKCGGTGCELNQEEVNAAWREMYKSVLKDECVDDVAYDFKILFNTANIKNFIIAQYRSNTFLWNNDECDEITTECMNQIKTMIVDKSHEVDDLDNFLPFPDDLEYMPADLYANIHNINKWIVGMPKWGYANE